MRVPAVDVTVKTRFAEATALLQVVSAGIERGALRLPGRLPCGRTFEIALLTASGELAIRGTAEAIRVDGDATLVRFLSASDDGSDRDAWVDLDDAVVTVAPTMAAPTTAAAGALRPRLRDRGDWVGAHGTPTPTSVPLPTPRVAAPPIPPLPPARSRAAAAPSELPALAPPARGPVGSMPLPRVDLAPPEIAPEIAPPEVAPPEVAPPERDAREVPPPLTASAAPEPPRSAPGATAPPPMMAMWPGPTGYYLAPAPFDPQARLRPTTLPPGWGAEQGRMWIPVVDPAAMPVVAAPAPAAPSVAPAPPTRAARGLLAASIVIAAAGAAVAVSAVWWARSVSAQRAAPPVSAAAPAVAGAAEAKAAVAAVVPVTAPAPVAPTVEPAPAPAPVAPTVEPAPAPVAPPVEPAPAPVPPSVEPTAAAALAPTVEPSAAAAPTRCRLAITTNADRVAIYVDGRLRGQAPATVDVPCHGELALRHPRYQEQVRTLALAGDDALHVVLARPRAQLRIVTRPTGATVKLGGRVVGRTPLTAPVDGFERASVTLSAPGYATETRAAYVKGGTTVLAVTLKRP